MKITLWGINYSPEATGIAPFNRELCEYLAGRGHEVSAVTAFFYYPVWKKRPEDHGKIYRTDKIGNVSVRRCWCYVPERVTTIKRIMHELTFCTMSALRVLSLPRADVYVVVSPPLALGLFAWIATRLKGSRFIFHVQDLQPDAAVGLGMLKKGWLVRTLYGLERLAYKKAAVVSGISEGMLKAFRDKGVPETRRVMLPNWLREGFTVSRDAVTRQAARRRFGVSDDALLAIYAGNLGKKQSLEILGEVAAMLASAPDAGRIRILIAGDGAGRADLEKAVHASGFAGVELLPLLSDEDYVALLAAADVSLITQAAGTGQFFFPSKLLTALAAGLPVVAVADDTSELAAAVHEGGFGCVVPPGAAAELTALLRKLAQEPGTVDGWAQRMVWVRKFARDLVLPRFEAVLGAVASGRNVAQADSSQQRAPAERTQV